VIRRARYSRFGVELAERDGYMAFPTVEAAQRHAARILLEG
jgi:hypothetical protein